MAFNQEYIKNLQEIIDLIKEDKISGEGEATEKFDKYINDIQSIGHFSLLNWKANWRKLFWAFGELFGDNDPNEFLKIVENKLNSAEDVNHEVLEFIKMEITTWNLPDVECKNKLSKLIKKYPFNPEFRHTLGHYYNKEKKFIKSIEEYKLAIKIEPSNRDFVKNRFNTEYKYLNNLIKKGKYQKGKAYVDAVLDEKFYEGKHTIYHNYFVDFSQRFEDHILFNEKLTSIEKGFVDKMKSELESERKRIIEILGFFSAIVAFILSTVSIGENFSFSEAIYFIISLGVVLILFTFSISIFFAKSNISILKDIKFWIFIIALIFISAIIFKTGISTI